VLKIAWACFRCEWEKLWLALHFSAECFGTKTFPQRKMKKTGQVFRNYLFWVTYGDSQIDFLAGSREFYGGGTNMNMAGDYLPLRLSFSAGFSCKARFICKDKKEREN